MKPTYRDPLHDGAADPVVIWNRHERAWSMVYTSRRADGSSLPGVEWVHGSALGVASSADGGRTWTYRGDIGGLDTEWGRWTYWAPEIIDDDETCHMFVSVVRGIPGAWPGHERRIRHYTSPDLIAWAYRNTLPLSSDFVIDACVAALPTGGYRLRYKEEADDSHTWAADSADLVTWTVRGRAVDGRPHEGPNVFRLAGSWWMIVDEWHGQRVLRSDDLLAWQPQGLILDRSGSGADDAEYGHNADVVLTGEETATVFYFTHPERVAGGPEDAYPQRRTAVLAAPLRVADGTLVCDRDAPFVEFPLPAGGSGSS